MAELLSIEYEDSAYVGKKIENAVLVQDLKNEMK